MSSKGGKKKRKRKRKLVFKSSPVQKRHTSKGRRSVSKGLSVLTKRMIAASQMWRCADCTVVLPAGYSIDHLTARFLGGTDALTNLRALCPECHVLKTTFENSVRADLLKKRREHLERTLKEYTKIYEKLKEKRKLTVIRLRKEWGLTDFPGKLTPKQKPWRYEELRVQTGSS